MLLSAMFSHFISHTRQALRK